MDFKKHERISFDPKVMSGKPIIRGTQVTVEQILRYLANGATVYDVVDAFALKPGDIYAAIAFAADTLAEQYMPNEYQFSVTDTDDDPLIAEVQIQLTRGSYRLERYRSKTVKAFSLDANEYVSSTRATLQQIVSEKRLPIPIKFSSGELKNTRTLGKDVIEYLLKTRD